MVQHKININQADLDQLARAFQVSTEHAQAILQKRKELGGFKSWEDVQQVPGVSEGMVKDLKDAGATIGGEASSAAEEEEEEEEEE
jgi:competence ComEA-like helix-hairpin-helix protein